MTVDDSTALRTRQRPGVLLERDEELRAIDSAIADAKSGRGSVVLVEGEAGIGKSSLIASAIERAASDGLSTLMARGGELESQYAYGVVAELFARALRTDADRQRLLVGAAAAAGPVFNVSPASAGQPMPDPLGALHGLYWLSVALAEERPLLLAIDDAQWADDASVRFLQFLAQRVTDLPIALVIGLRPRQYEESGALEELRSRPNAIRVTPGRLSQQAVGALVLQSQSEEPGVAVVHACWLATRGNPFYVHELLRDPNVATLLLSDEMLPERVSRSVRQRVGQLDEDARLAAEAIAVLGDEADLRRVASLAGMDDSATISAVRRLIEGSIIEREADLAFIHPIVREAVYASMPGVARAQIHRRAADILRDDRAPIEAVGAHLLVAERGADRHVVTTLRDASRAAAQRGDLPIAIACLERALVEPPPEEDLADVLVELARLESAAGIPSAVGRYRTAIARVDDPARRAELYHELGLAEIAAARWGDAASSFHDGLELAGGIDEALATKLEASFVSTGWITMDRHSEASERLDRILRLTELAPAQRDLIAWTAFQRTADLTGTAEEVLALVARALDEPMEQLVKSPQRIEVVAGALVGTDELPREIDLLTQALEAVRRSASFAKYGIYVYCRSWPLYFSGRLTDAIADAQAAIRAAELGWETFMPAASTVLSWALLERGEIDAAEDAIAFDPEPWGQRVDLMILVPIARARIALARNDPAGALEHLAAARAGADAIGMRMSVPPDWRSPTVMALARLGRRREAVELAEEGVQLARQWGAKWPLGVALRVAGIAHGGTEGVARLEEATAQLAASPARLEHARALVHLGAAARRTGRRALAREHLSAGMDMAHGLGAYAIAEEARSELVAAGARPRRLAVTGVSSLTPSELRVAQMVAQGRTNREVAQSLFITPKAVEYHLGNAYRKLQISSRADLPGALRQPADGDSV